MPRRRSTIEHLDRASSVSLDTVTKAATTSVVALYVLALATVNAYLFRLGVSDFELLRTRFVLTGVWPHSRFWQLCSRGA